MIHTLVWVAIVLGLLVLTASGRKLIPRDAFRSEQAAIIIPALVSIAVLAAAGVVVWSGRYDALSQKLACGAAGAVLGFWLKSQA